MQIEARADAVAASRPPGGARLGGIGPMSLAAVILIVCAACHLKTCLTMVRSGSGNIAGEEMNVVWGIQRLSLHGALYADPAASPYGVIQYAPVYYRVCAGAAALAGVGAGDAAGITEVARSISLACLLGQVLITCVILRRHLSAAWSLVVSAGVCLLIVQGDWGVTARPDTMEVMVAALAMLLALDSVRAAKAGGRAVAWLTLSMLAVALAGLVKQNGIEAGLYALPGAAVVLGWRRTASACVAAAVLAVPLVLLAFSGLGPASAVKANLVGGLNNGVNPAAALILAYMPYLKVMSVLVAAGLLAAIAPWLRLIRGPGEDRDAVTPAELILGWATVASLGFAVLTGLKFGSAPNYFLLFNLFAIVTVARYLEVHRGPEAGRWASAWSWFPALYLVVFLPVQAFEARLLSTRLGDLYADCAEVTRRLRDELARDPEGSLFFSCDPRLDVLLPDRCAVPQKLVAGLLDRRGVVDYSGFARDVTDGRVRYCITFTPRSSPPDLAEALRAFSVANQGVDPGPGRAVFVGASFDRFRPLFRVGPHTVYVSPEGPRPAAARP
jgi:hypothetical protein